MLAMGKIAERCDKNLALLVPFDSQARDYRLSTYFCIFRNTLGINDKNGAWGVKKKPGNVYCRGELSLN